MRPIPNSIASPLSTTTRPTGLAALVAVLAAAGVVVGLTFGLIPTATPGGDGATVEVTSAGVTPQ